MSKLEKNIYEEYQNADFEKRVYLFLKHRNFRNDFIAIDQRTKFETKPKMIRCCSKFFSLFL